MAQPNAPKQPAPAARMRSSGALERVVLRNEFYRDKFRMMVTSVPILAAATLASIILNFVQANRPPERFFFTVDTAGRVIPIRALTEPYVTDAFLLNWTSEQVSRAYSMDPQNFRRQAADLASSFTTEGYEQYVKSLQDSGTIDLMQKNLLVSSGVAQGAPVVIDRGIANGLYFWKLQVPMLVSYRSAVKGTEKKRVVTVTVVRRMTLENPLGIGINQFVAVDV
jgi:intracellular multiplication protein IcmL